MKKKLYDRAYFDHWYRDPRTRINVRAGIARKVALAVHAAEYLLERPIRNVLDVGCGEGAWQPLLARLRPGVRYLGVDSSPYAAARFGGSRNIVQGSFGELERLGIEGPFDLIVCADVLHYVPRAELEPGLAVIAELLGGVAWVEVFTAADDIAGDFRELKRRRPVEYARIFRKVGLVPCGLYCLVRDDFAFGTTAFERGGATVGARNGLAGRRKSKKPRGLIARRGL